MSEEGSNGKGKWIGTESETDLSNGRQAQLQKNKNLHHVLSGYNWNSYFENLYKRSGKNNEEDTKISIS